LAPLPSLTVDGIVHNAIGKSTISPYRKIRCRRNLLAAAADPNARLAHLAL
jgi:hypothetical protein